MIRHRYSSSKYFPYYMPLLLSSQLDLPAFFSISPLLKESKPDTQPEYDRIHRNYCLRVYTVSEHKLNQQQGYK